MRKRILLYYVVIVGSFLISLYMIHDLKTTYIEYVQESEDKIEKLNVEIDYYKMENKRLREEYENIKEEKNKLRLQLHEKEKALQTTTRGITSRTFNVTAYNDTPACQGKWVGQTASGNSLKEWHTVAAGKSIPFGTVLYIPYFKNKPNKGIFVVEDRGGAIKDNNLDIFMISTEEALEFGRRDLKVKILKWGDKNDN